MKSNQKEEDLPPEKVEIKIGFCKKCKGHISAAVWHMMNKKQRIDFMKQAATDDLDTKTITLKQHQKNPNWGCKCKKPRKENESKTKNSKAA